MDDYQKVDACSLKCLERIVTNGKSIINFILQSYNVIIMRPCFRAEFNYTVPGTLYDYTLLLLLQQKLKCQFIVDLIQQPLL